MDQLPDSSPDYVWHFTLSSDQRQVPPDDALAEMLREQLRAILGCVVLTSSGTDLRVTGFRFLSERETEHPIYPEALAEPQLSARVEPGDAEQA
jgi:hypothetical protein